MNFREQAAIAALQALIIAETYTPRNFNRPVRPDARVLATQAWNHADALIETAPGAQQPIEMMTLATDKDGKTGLKVDGWGHIVRDGSPVNGRRPAAHEEID